MRILKILFLLLLAISISPQRGSCNILPPMVVKIDYPEADFKSGKWMKLPLTSLVVNTTQAGDFLKLTLDVTGIVESRGPTQWIIKNFNSTLLETVYASVRITGYGEGSIKFRVDCFNTQNKLKFSQSERLYLLKTPDAVTYSENSAFELWRQKLVDFKKIGLIDETIFKLEMQKLLEGKELTMQQELRKPETWPYAKNSNQKTITP